MFFSDYLSGEGIDPVDVKLVRHSESGPNIDAYGLWSADPKAFLLFEQIQRRPIYDKVPLAAAFVVTPTGETLFVGLREIRKKRVAGRKDVSPLHERAFPGANFFC